MPKMLSFDDAVSISHQIINFFNSPESDPTILFLAQKFNLDIKNDFHVSVASISKNCSECSGCHGGSCTLGCYVSQDTGHAGRLCYWDKALESVVGTKLVVHELGHVIYDQIFTDNLNPQASFIQSEKFAQYMENHYDFDMSFNFDGFNENPIIEKYSFDDAKLSAMRIGEFVIAGSIIAIISYAVHRKYAKKLNIF